MKLLVYASGYIQTPWKNDQQEIRCKNDPRCGGDKDCHWSPSSKDFAAVANASGGGSPAKSIDELVKVISQQAVDSIEELRIIGHANDQVLALAGEIKRDDVYFTQPQSYIGPSSQFEAAMPQFRNLQDRFTANAQVILLGCNSGSGKQTILSIVSHAFLRTVKGFQDEIKYNFEWKPTGAAFRTSKNSPIVCFNMVPKSSITLRGRMRYSPHTSGVSQTDALASAFGEASMLSLYETDAWKLTPDMSNNDGDVFIAVRRSDPATASTELVWRIMKEFFPSHAYVSGTGVDATVPGLRVRKAGGGFMIDINPTFAAKTTPQTLKNRIAEVEKALKLVAGNAVGVVPMT
jgi:hypothetical protein